MLHLLEQAATLPLPLLYLLIALLAFGESAALLDLVIPGETGMVFMGAVIGRAGGSLALAILVCTVGAVVGDSLGFAVGRRWGWALVGRWEWVRRRLEPQVERAETFFNRHTGVAVFTGRWVGALRAVAPLVAGTTTLSYRTYLAWDAAAALPWSAVVVGAGYWFGDDAARVIDRFALWFSLLAVTAIVTFVVIRRRRAARRQPLS